MHSLPLAASPRRSRQWLAALALALAQGASAEAPQTPLALPKLPTSQERHPHWYDEYGCDKELSEVGKMLCRENMAIARIEAMKPISAAERARLLATPAELNVDKRLRGFEDPYYTPLPAVGAAVVLEETVTLSATPSGGFHAIGLVRNETLEPLTAIWVTARLMDAIEPLYFDAIYPLTAIWVTARLMDAQGTVLAQETAPAAVAPLRPGEPAPSELSSAVLFQDVAKLQWSVDSRVETDAAKLAWRDVEFGLKGISYESRFPWGDRERVDEDTVTKPPYAHLEVGRVRNLGGKGIPHSKIVRAWYQGTKAAIRMRSTIQRAVLRQNTS